MTNEELIKEILAFDITGSIAKNIDEQDIKNSGFDKWFDTQINLFLNCRKVMSNGQRVTSTDHYGYKLELKLTYMLIDELIETQEEKDKYFDILLSKHRDNIEFERTVPDTYVPMKTKKNKTTKDKSEKQANKKPIVQFKIVIPGI